jgi:hypothetical protein
MSRGITALECGLTYYYWFFFHASLGILFVLWVIKKFNQCFLLFQTVQVGMFIILSKAILKARSNRAVLRLCRVISSECMIWQTTPFIASRLHKMPENRKTTQLKWAYKVSTESALTMQICGEGYVPDSNKRYTTYSSSKDRFSAKLLAFLVLNNWALVSSTYV